MRKRKKLSKSYSKKLFKSSALRTHRRNRSSINMRGGIRL